MKSYKVVSVIVLLITVSLALFVVCAKNSPKTGTKSVIASNTTSDETDELSERLGQYKSFLQDEISSETKSDGFWYLRDFCNVAVPEKDGEKISYALYDMTGDGLPELHVLTDISYSVHTIENDQLITWYTGDRYCRPLNNGAILEKIESTGIHYGYYFLDNKGEMFLCVGFSEPPKGAKKNAYKYLFGTGGADAPYDYNDTVVSKKKWDKLTKPFLAMSSDKIVWKDISNLDF